MKLTFDVTKNMQAYGIEFFKLVTNDFQLSLSGGKTCCVHFSPKKSSINEERQKDRDTETT